MSRYSELRNKYYLKPYVENMRAKGLTETAIADLLGCSRQAIRDAALRSLKESSIEVGQLLGEPSVEYLRVAAELECLKILVTYGWQAARADPKCVFDVFAVKEDQTITIQVKSTTKYSARGWPQFSIDRMQFNTKRQVRSSYKAGDFDFWFFYNISGDSWLIPFAGLDAKHEISMEGFDKFYTGPLVSFTEHSRV